jgi:aspartate racemase
MEQDFYKEKFRAHAINSLVPGEEQREFVQDLIYRELCVGKLLPESREKLRIIILELQRAGAEAVVLACTELPLLIRSEDTPVKLFDTMTLHVRKAVAFALEQ